MERYNSILRALEKLALCTDPKSCETIDLKIIASVKYQDLRKLYSPFKNKIFFELYGENNIPGFFKFWQTTCLEKYSSEGIQMIYPENEEEPSGKLNEEISLQVLKDGKKLHASEIIKFKQTKRGNY